MAGQLGLGLSVVNDKIGYVSSTGIMLDVAYRFTHLLSFAQYLSFGVSGGIINGGTNAVVSDISEGHKGADLSLLGVFFGLGALGMPLVLGALQKASLRLA